jgi:cytochrome oxidase Cu insertion factor (SCO1/SenC/PrrC family)
LSAAAQPAQERSHRRQLVLLAIGIAGIAGIAIGVVAHLVTAGGSPAAPGSGFHGQASWGPEERRAPPFTLRDHRGASVSLEALAGRPVLLTFFDSQCKEQCPIEGTQLATILRDLKPDERPTLLIVSVNPGGDTPASIRKAMAAWRLTGPWRSHWLRGTQRDLAPVWREYGIEVQPTTNNITHGLVLYLIDREGYQRTGYLFPFLPNFVARDLRSLARTPD